MRRTDEIIAFAKDIRKNWGCNPMEIAERFGIRVNYSDGTKPSAYTIKLTNYPTVIRITGCNNCMSGAMVLCAHELGHALLHDDGVNLFSGTSKTIINEVEYEANLFAVALLFSEDDFNIPIRKMNNYILKTILDYNLPGK